MTPALKYLHNTYYYVAKKKNCGVNKHLAISMKTLMNEGYWFRPFSVKFWLGVCKRKLNLISFVYLYVQHCTYVTHFRIVLKQSNEFKQGF